jgi:hypothetical protein
VEQNVAEIAFACQSARFDLFQSSIVANGLPRIKLAGIKKIILDHFPKVAPLNVLIGGPVRVSAWIPA